jgi:hypothetical protein
VRALAIHQLLENRAFDPTSVRVLIAAYDTVCVELDLAESRYAAANELVAIKVIEIAQTGERDLKTIVQRALEELRRS